MMNGLVNPSSWILRFWPTSHHNHQSTPQNHQFNLIIDVRPSLVNVVPEALAMPIGDTKYFPAFAQVAAIMFAAFMIPLQSRL
jgi:hypothetical protein